MKNIFWWVNAPAAHKITVSYKNLPRMMLVAWGRPETLKKLGDPMGWVVTKIWLPTAPWGCVRILAPIGVNPFDCIAGQTNKQTQQFWLVAALSNWIVCKWVKYQWMVDKWCHNLCDKGYFSVEGLFRTLCGLFLLKKGNCYQNKKNLGAPKLQKKKNSGALR
jgi:hypothetical protein